MPNTNTNTNTLATKVARFKEAASYGGIVNFTPHAVTVAGTTYPASGIVARVESSYEEIVDGITTMTLGKVKFYKGQEEFALTGHDCEGVVHIVSGLVFEAVKDWHCGVWVAPATGHPLVERNDKGHIISVPAFLM